VKGNTKKEEFIIRIVIKKIEKEFIILGVLVCVLELVLPLVKGIGKKKE